jgi:hypothetical protein
MIRRKAMFETVMKPVEMLGAFCESLLVKIVNSLPEIKFL